MHLSCQNQNVFCAAMFSNFLASWPETMKTSEGYHNLDKTYFAKTEHKRKTYPYQHQTSRVKQKLTIYHSLFVHWILPSCFVGQRREDEQNHHLLCPYGPYIERNRHSQIYSNKWIYLTKQDLHYVRQLHIIARECYGGVHIRLRTQRSLKKWDRMAGVGWDWLLPFSRPASLW